VTERWCADERRTKEETKRTPHRLSIALTNKAWCPTLHNWKSMLRYRKLRSR
jgi:hypothetical protein